MGYTVEDLIKSNEFSGIKIIKIIYINFTFSDKNVDSCAK